MDETSVLTTAELPAETPSSERRGRPAGLLMALAAFIGLLGIVLAVVVMTSEGRPEAGDTPSPVTVAEPAADEAEPDAEAPTPVGDPDDPGVVEPPAPAPDPGPGPGPGPVEPPAPAPALLEVPAEVNLGVASTGSFDITNAGDEDLDVAFADVPNVLTLTMAPGPITGGDSVSVDVAIDKTGFPNGPYSLDFKVLSNGGGATVDVNGTEFVIALPFAEMSVPGEVDFGTANAGKVEIENTGTATLHVDLGGLVAANVEVIGLPASVEPGESVEIIVNIDTDAMPGGAWQRTITLDSNGGDANVTIKGFKVVVADPGLFLPDLTFDP